MAMMELYELTLVVTCVQEKAIRDVFAENDWKFIIAGIKKHEQAYMGLTPSSFGVQEEAINSKVPDELNVDEAGCASKHLHNDEAEQSKFPLKGNAKHSNRQGETINGQEETTDGKGGAMGEEGETSNEEEGISEEEETTYGQRKAIEGGGETSSEEGDTMSDQVDESEHGDDQIKGDATRDQGQKDSESKWIYCSICGEVFTENCTLEMHMKKHESPSKKRSKFLSLVKSRTSPRIAHKKAEPTAQAVHPASSTQMRSKPNMSVRGRPPRRTGSPILKNEKFKCATCLESFQNMEDLSFHLKSHVDQMPFVCTACGEMFKARDAFEEHLFNHSQKTKSIPVPSNQPRTPARLCKTCGRSFPNQAALIVHQRVHTGERPYLCTDCGKAFKQVSAFQSHTRTHTGETPYKCKICGDAFRQLGELQRHVRKHTGEKPHLCTVCGNRFAELSYLKSHMRLHTGEKPYQCTSCGKSFSQRTSLKVHIKCHHNTTTGIGDHVKVDPMQGSADGSQHETEYRGAFPIDMSLHVPMESYNMSYLTSGLTQSDRDRNAMSMSFDASYYA